MNMKSVFKSVGVFSLIIFCSGCLSQLKTRDDLRGQTPASQSQPESPIESSPVSENVDPEPLPAYQQQEKNEQMRVLYGRIEEAENQVQELRQSMIELANSRIREKEESAAKLQAYEEAIRNLEAQVESLKSTPTKAPSKASNGKDSKDSNAKLREDYHRGEDFFRQKKWKDAIVSYQKYRDTYPKGKFYPEATYNMGLCFVELGLKDESKSFFEEVRVKFPKSPLAKKAEKQLKSL